MRSLETFNKISADYKTLVDKNQIISHTLLEKERLFLALQEQSTTNKNLDKVQKEYDEKWERGWSDNKDFLRQYAHFNAAELTKIVADEAAQRALVETLTLKSQ